MDELIKVANNGQWTLEKAMKPSTKELIEQFLANKARGADAPRPLSPTRAPAAAAAGLRPADHATGANPLYSKEQVARFRAATDQSAKGPKPVVKLSPEEAEDAKMRRAAEGERKALKDQRASVQEHAESVSSKLDNEQARDEERAKAGQGRKAAWEKTAQFLSQKGGEFKEKRSPEVMGAGYGYGTSTRDENKGWDSIYQNLQNKKAVAAAAKGLVKPTKRELMPPQEMSRDENNQPIMIPRVGKFHGDGAQTRGKIVNKKTMYPLPGQEGVPADQLQYGHTSHPAQEIHHWGWDHDKKKWNHIRTELGSTTNR